MRVYAPDSVRRLLAHMKSDLAPWLFRRGHQLPDRFQDRRDLVIVHSDTLFEFRKLLC